MKYFKYIFILILFGCSSSKVIYDYDLKTDFSQYKTYGFFEDAGDGMNELDVKRFVRAIEVNLDSIGYKKSEKPDFYINMISEKREAHRNRNVGVGVGAGGRNSGISISTDVFFGGKKINEIITIEFVTSSDDKLFWEGVLNIKVKEKIKPEERIVVVREAVKKILTRYPPNN